MDETITKASDEKIKVTKVIPEQVVETEYCLNDITEKIACLKQELEEEEAMLVREEYSSLKHIAQFRSRIDEMKANLAVWQNREAEANKLLAKEPVKDPKVVLEG